TVDQEPLPLPDLCESIKCPPDGEMQCPADSSIRQNLLAVDLIKSNAVELPGDISSGDSTSIASVAYNSSLISDEDYVRCCVNRKCVCKTCYIPDCDTDSDADELVVVELVTEKMQTPGECCGTYDCRTEPNCTVVRNTEYHWLKQCQRCKCESGLKICHKDCDDRAEGVCQSKISGMFYKDGETWTENCQTCECEKGEPKCTMSFCGNLNCPSERQVMLKDTCCPVCWPKCAPMPNEAYGDYVDESEAPETETETETELDTEPETEEDPLPPLLPDPLTTQQSAELIASSTTTTTTTTAAPPVAATTNVCNNAFDQPNVVEVLNQSNYFSYWLLAYAVLASIAIVVMGFYIYLQRAKKRSYDPVSILDHSI
ncbi:hypothetical protein KR084_006693, partial [Drosophila pseudotakahashii]